jgi:hypothetical protein
VTVQWVTNRPRVRWLGAIELFQPTGTLDDVVPEVRPKFDALIAYAKTQGMTIKVRSVGRTCAAQQEQVDLGYSQADFCRSMHVIGHAVDFDVIPNTCSSYTKLGEWWESQGGVWGGRWKQFGACGDAGHFHYGFNKAQAVPTSICPAGVTEAQCRKVREDYLTKAFGQPPLGTGGSRMGILNGLLIVGAAAAILYATMNVKVPARLRDNPHKDPKTMTPAEINRELDQIDKKRSELNDEFIEAGRGSETVNETWKKDDPLALRYKELSNRHGDLQREIYARYGPGAPSRMPKGFKRRR